MARRKADLIKEASEQGLWVPAGSSTENIMDALRDKYNDPQILLPQIEVILAHDTGEDPNAFDISKEDFWNTSYMRHNFFENDKLVAEEKENGMRYKMHFTTSGIRVDSRKRSDRTYAFSEKTDNFPQFKNYINPEMIGTVLDSEFRHKLARVWTGKVWTASTLNSTGAICNSGPDIAIEIQKTYGPIDAHVFDVIFYKGDDVRNYSFNARRKLLERICRELSHPNIICTNFVRENKQAFFESIIHGGGEGCMFKSLDGVYESGKRSRFMWKLKKLGTADVFITGFIPGENANTGQVGSIVVSMVTRDGKRREVGAFTNMTQDERVDYTEYDGTLKARFYDKVVEVKYFEVSKNGRLSHCRKGDWRPDKNPVDCVYEDQVVQVVL